MARSSTPLLLEVRPHALWVMEHTFSLAVKLLLDTAGRSNAASVGRFCPLVRLLLPGLPRQDPCYALLPHRGVARVAAAAGAAVCAALLLALVVVVLYTECPVSR